MGDYLAAIWRCRYFWLSLVKNDLRTRYRRSVLGMGWSLLHPICMTTILTAVFYKLWNLPISEFAPFVLAGLATWNYVLTVAAHRAGRYDPFSGGLVRGDDAVLVFPWLCQSSGIGISLANHLVAIRFCLVCGRARRSRQRVFPRYTTPHGGRLPNAVLRNPDHLLSRAVAKDQPGLASQAQSHGRPARARPTADSQRAGPDARHLHGRNHNCGSHVSGGQLDLGASAAAAHFPSVNRSGMNRYGTD